jgi:predicted AAA+ superfamily ATPase
LYIFITIFKGLSFDVPDTRSSALLSRALREYMDTGGFPEVVKSPDIRNAYLSSLYSSIISRDIVDRHRIRFTKTFRELSLTVLSNFSRMVSYNKLKNTHGLKSVHTAKNYMEHLEEAYLIFTLEKYSPKVKEIMNSPRKVYAVDTGLINSLSVSPSEDTGLLMENIVFLELMRKRAVTEGMEIYYYRDGAQREVDFLIRRGNSIEELIQVTHASGRDEIARREINALLRASESTGCGNMKIITWDYEGWIEVDARRIEAVPLWKWLYFRA